MLNRDKRGTMEKTPDRIQGSEPFLNACRVPGTELNTEECTDLKEVRKLRLRNVRLGVLLPTCDVTVGSVIISLGLSFSSLKEGYCASSECSSSYNIPRQFEKKTIKVVATFLSLSGLIGRVGDDKRYKFSVTEVILSPLKSKMVHTESSKTKDSFLFNIFSTC